VYLEPLTFAKSGPPRQGVSRRGVSGGAVQNAHDRVSYA